MKINYKVKRFLKRNFKRLIHCIIYFSVLSSLIVNCYAVVYDNISFGELVDDGYCKASVYTSSGTLLTFDEFTAEEVDYRVTISYPKTQPFDDVVLQIYDSSFLSSYTFGANDVFVLSHPICVRLRGEDVYNTASDFKEAFQFFLRLYNPSTYQTKFITVSGDDVLNNVIRTEGENEYGIYVDFTANVLLNVYIPDGFYIETLEYDFYGLGSNFFSFVAEMFSNNYDGSSTEFATVYFGSVDNAPIYNAPDGSSLDDYSKAESELLNQFFGDTDFNIEQEIGGIFSGALDNKTWLSRITVVSRLISEILDRIPFINYVMYFGLSVGLFSFIFSVAKSFFRST